MLAVAHTVDGTLQLLVGIHGVQLHEVVVALDSSEAVLTAILRVACSCHQPLQHVALQLLAVRQVLLQLAHARGEYMSY